MIFDEEEDTLSDVATASNSAQGGRAVKAAIDAAATMTAERPRAIAWIRLAVGTDKCPNHFHKISNCLAQELLSFVPMRPQLESVTIVLFFSSFDIAISFRLLLMGYFAHWVLTAAGAPIFMEGSCRLFRPRPEINNSRIFRNLTLRFLLSNSDMLISGWEPIPNRGSDSER